jgi:hypothetical protein
MLSAFLRRVLHAGSVPPAPATHAFDHAAAQQYELESAHITIREAYPQLLERWKAANVRGRKCVEIGRGPFGYLAPAWWIRDRVLIEPLAEDYRAAQLALCGESWFADVRCITTPAEVLVPDLLGNVDGCIVCRNALDHCEDTLAVLDTISEYAAPGCWLLLWTDIWHLGGLDAGHHNITRSAAAMAKLVRSMGFDILQLGAPIRSASEYLEFGCLARKAHLIPRPAAA